MIPACFSNPESVSSSSTQAPQSLVICIYQTTLCHSQTNLTLTWSKTHYSHSLTIYSAEYVNITIPLYPSTFPFFRARHGTKSLHLINGHRQETVKLHWDFTRAEFSHSSAEPVSCFYLAMTSKTGLEFFLGDRSHDFTRRSSVAFTLSLAEPRLLSRREHVFGTKSFSTKADLMGSRYDILIECSGGGLKLKIDGLTRLTVKRLAWKFRGNEKIFLDGMEVEFYWDVYRWMKQCHDRHKCSNNYGVFVFQIGDGGMHPGMVGAERRLMRKSWSSAVPGSASAPTSPSCSSVMQWAEDSSDHGRSSWSSASTRFSVGNTGGFSFLLYAWRKD